MLFLFIAGQVPSPIWSEYLIAFSIYVMLYASCIHLLHGIQFVKLVYTFVALCLGTFTLYQLEVCVLKFGDERTNNIWYIKALKIMQIS